MFPGHSVYSFFSPESGHIRRILPLENFWQTRRTLFRSCICRQHKACCYFLNAFVIVRCPYCSPLTSSVYRGVFLHSSEQYRELLFLLWKSFPQIIHFSTILSPLFKKRLSPSLSLVPNAVWHQATLLYIVYWKKTVITIGYRRALSMIW